jgi:hypothetical protein
MNRTSETDVSQTAGKKKLDRSLSAGRKSDGKADAGWLKSRGSSKDATGGCDMGQGREGRRVGGSGFRIVAKKCTTSRLDTARGKDIVYNCSDAGPYSPNSIECSEQTNAKMLRPDSRSKDICLPQQYPTLASDFSLAPSTRPA